MLEQDLVAWFSENLSVPVHYQHLDRNPSSKFAWLVRSGDDNADSLDDSGEPDIVFFDLEIYASSLTDFQDLAILVRALRDYRGTLGESYVDDIAITDQIDDYEYRANADSLPEYRAAFRITVSGYQQ